MIKRPEREAYHSYPSSVEVKNMWSRTPLPRPFTWHVFSYLNMGILPKTIAFLMYYYYHHRHHHQ
jgi:hypothetical protein